MEGRGPGVEVCGDIGWALGVLFAGRLSLTPGKGISRAVGAATALGGWPHRHARPSNHPGGRDLPVAIPGVPPARDGASTAPRSGLGRTRGHRGQLEPSLVGGARAAGVDAGAGRRYPDAGRAGAASCGGRVRSKAVGVVCDLHQHVGRHAARRARPVVGTAHDRLSRHEVVGRLAAAASVCCRSARSSCGRCSGGVCEWRYNDAVGAVMGGFGNPVVWACPFCVLWCPECWAAGWRPSSGVWSGV